MHVVLTKQDKGILVQARAEGEDVLGDASWLIAPNEDFFGIPYKQLSAMEDGEHDLTIESPQT